jgi:FtsH-binding integral membrane protein
MKKALFWSLVSGFVWIAVAGAVAYGISPTSYSTRRTAGAFAGGIVAAPLIGLLIGSISRRFSDLGGLPRLWIALGNLYFATYLFLLASGVGQVLHGWITERHVQTVQQVLVVNPLMGALWGLTYTGFVIVLLPLSYWNHALIGRVWKGTTRID